LNIIGLFSKMPKYTGFPRYYDKAKGAYIYINGVKYLDMSLSGIGCNILGYADRYVNHYVKKAINQGNMATLNPRIEDELHHMILDTHYWATDVRYARTGGEAIEIAYQLAIEKRATFNIMQVGYNGWHIKNKQKEFWRLDKINDIEDISDRPDILIFELARHEYPTMKTICRLNKWQREGTVLIIDEITTGYRFCNGGLHMSYGLKPDICVFAKGISNGYPMAVIIGKREMIESGLWISSTYWTESIGPTSAYYTIKKLEKCNYAFLKKLGQAMIQTWVTIARINNLDIRIGEVPEIANFKFNYYNHVECKTVFVREMLKQGVLATDQYYPNFSQKMKHLKRYMNACNKAFAEVRRYLNNPYNINKLEVLDK
jgi:glutamate-1-semialdehyde aminotransferase